MLIAMNAAETVKTFLESMNLQPVEHALAGGIAFLVTFDGPADQGIAQIFTDDERFVFHFIFPGYVDVSRRPQVAEFITRANWGLIEGNFEMSFDDGALRYKVGIDFSSTELTEPLVRNAILSGMYAIERHVEGLIAVASGKETPAEAFARGEATTNTKNPS